MTIEDLRRQAVEMQSAGGPYANLGARLTKAQDFEEASSIFQEHEALLRQPPIELSDAELGGFAGGMTNFPISNLSQQWNLALQLQSTTLAMIGIEREVIVQNADRPDAYRPL